MRNIQRDLLHLAELLEAKSHSLGDYAEERSEKRHFIFDCCELDVLVAEIRQKVIELENMFSEGNNP